MADKIIHAESDKKQATVKLLNGSSNNPKIVIEENEVDQTLGDANGVDGKAKDKDIKKKDAPVEMVPISKMFRFADAWDGLLLFGGMIFAVLCAFAFPLLIILFGQITDAFIYEKHRKDMMEDLLNWDTFNWFAQGRINWTSLEQQETMLDKMTVHCINFTIIGFAFWACAYGMVFCWCYAASRQCVKMRHAFFTSVLSQNIGWFDENKSGELNNRLIDDISTIERGMGDKLGIFINQFLAGAFCFILSFYKGWLLALVVMSMAPLIVVASTLMAKALSSASDHETAAYAEAGGVAEEAIGNMRTVTAFNGQSVECKRFNSKLHDAFKQGVLKGIYSGLGLGFTMCIIFSSYCLGFWYGHSLVQEDMKVWWEGCSEAAIGGDEFYDYETYGTGEMLPIAEKCLIMPDGYTPGNMLMVFFGIMFGSFGIGGAFPHLAAFATARGAAKTIFEIIDRKSEINAVNQDTEENQNDHQNREKMITLDEKTDQTVQFKDVNFEYPSRPDVKVLKGLNLTVKPGERVAIVGHSGCGKSTVVQLLQRFYDPTSGQITLGGVDTKELDLKWLRGQMGVVGQEPVLFDGSVADNIKYGSVGCSVKAVTDEQCETAAKAANAHDFIMKLPQKYSTMVGEQGAALSGGQKQRIAIARAIVRNPKMLLLDEATSALDTESESIVQSALDKASEGRTTLVIAHRLSTIRDADQILVFDGGIVTESGTHAELMKLNGTYSSMVEAQSMAEDGNEYEDDAVGEVGGGIGDGKRRLSQQKRMQRSTSVGSGGGGGGRKALSADEEAIEQEVEEPEPSPEVGIGRVMKMNAKELPFILLGCLGAGLNGACQPLFGIVFGDILGVFEIEDEDDQKAEALFWSLMFIVIGVGTGIANFLQSSAFAISGEALTRRMRKRVFKAIMRHDIGWFDRPKNATGALTTKLAVDASAVKGASGIQLGVVMQAMSSMVIGLVLAFFYGWKLTLVILAFVPFVIVGGAIGMRIMTGFTAKAKEGLVEGGKVASEVFQHMRTVASFGLERQMIVKYKQTLVAPHKKDTIRSHVQGISYGFSQAIMFFADAAAFYFGAVFVSNGEMDFETVMKVFGCILFSAMAAGQASSFAPDYGKAKIACNDMFALLDEVPEIDSEDQSGARMEAVKGNVKAENVEFHYPTRQTVQVLQGLNLDVREGKTLALVGSSGCGKSTIVSLLERFYNPVTGTISLEELPIDKLRIDWLRQQMAIVSQEPKLFDRTIHENIVYGLNDREGDVSREEVIEAATQANAHSFISQLPLGYDTRAGQKGSQLSGGQKQRIAIARAIIRKPKILLLDEATSALDSQSEKVVQEALDAARQNRTCIVIAHRLSTIQNADQIAVIDGGQVIELGTHGELIKIQDGTYAKLQKAQSLAV